MMKQKTFQIFLQLYLETNKVYYLQFKTIHYGIKIKIMIWKILLNRNKTPIIIIKTYRIIDNYMIPPRIAKKPLNPLKIPILDTKYDQYKQFQKTQDFNKMNGSFSPREQISFGDHLFKIMQTLRKQLKIDRMEQIEARDKFVYIELPPKTSQNSISDETLQEWITEVCNRTFSTAFNSLYKDLMTFNHTKIFCSESILRNIYELNKTFQLKTQQMIVLNNHLEEYIVPFMQTKYPLTESHDVNKAINQSVKPIDNREALSNDFLQKSDIVFKWDASENYNALIMKFLNWLMREIDLQNNDQKSPYQQFYSQMSQLFQNVYDETWMKSKAQHVNQNKEQNKPKDQNAPKESKDQSNSKEPKVQGTPNEPKEAKVQGIPKDPALQNDSKDHPNDVNSRRISKKQQHLQNEAKFSQQKYASIVKQYTHYSIGRKIPKDIPLYTDDQIANGYLSIKNASILRILTKWCEQLREKFTKKNYFLDRQENIRVQQVNGNQNTMFMWMKSPLNQMMEQQKKNIEKFMKDLIQHNFDQQSLLLIKQLQNDGFTHINRIEKACGKFAVKTVKNLHCYIVSYLNRLIHGLLNVSKKLYETKLSSKTRWTSPPDLISFKIGDLMRCKCSSKQREILKIFNEIQRQSEKKNGSIKIIRVKNRLKMGTNDILINILFKKKFLCEIQLAVNSATTNNFIKCSNLFSHYIYQLGRTLFGPITELCSIWMSLDARAGQYNKIVQKEKRLRIIQKVKCKDKDEHKYETWHRPFICSDCKYAFSHSNFIWDHQKCRDCNHIKCARCRLENENQNNLKKYLLRQLKDEIRSKCLSVVNHKDQKDRQIPEYGVCIPIKAKKVELLTFRKIVIKNIESIYGTKFTQPQRQQDTVKFKTQKEIQKLDQKLDINSQTVILIRQLINKDSVPAFFKDYIVFEISKEQGQKLITITEQKAKIQYVIPQKVKQIYIKQKDILSMIEEQLNDTEIQIIKGDPKQMKRITNMELADNSLQNVTFITSNFPNLTRLQLSRNILENIETISKLKHLKTLNLRNNKLKYLPDQICQLDQIQGLNIRHNQIEKLPQRFGHLLKLKKFEADDNKIETLPNGFQNLVQMNYLNLSENMLTVFPQKIRKFKKLQKLGLSKNQLVSVPEWISQFALLKMLDLKNGKLSNFPIGIFKLKQLQILKIETTYKQLSKEIKSLTNLKQLTIQMKNIQKLPDEMISLKHLYLFELEQCRMDELPDFLSQMKKLINFSLINNKVVRLSKEVTQMTRLKYLKIQGQLISDLPFNMKDLVQLKQLSLNNNKFKQIPAVVKVYKKLYKFSINNNQITSIDDDFFNELTELQELQFEQNKLQTLPESLQQLKKLMKLSYLKNSGIKQPKWMTIIKDRIKINSQMNFRTQKKKGITVSTIRSMGTM